MGLRFILRATKRKYKRYSGVVPSVNESTKFSSFELFHAKPPKRFILPESSSQILVPEAHDHLCSSNLTRIPCNLPFPWLHLLSKDERFSPSPTLLDDIAHFLSIHNYNAVLCTISRGGGKYPKKLWHYVHFALGYSYFKLNHFTEARQHLSECKLNATLEEDVAYCFLYLGKIASALQSYRKAAQHFRKAAVHFKKAGMICSDSSIVKTFLLEHISLSSLRLLSSCAFRQADQFYRALHDSTQAVQFAETDNERMKAHFECGRLYQLTVNHTSALNEFIQASELARTLGDSVSIQQAFMDSCDTCITLEEYDNALIFFEKALSCEIRSTEWISVPSIHQLEWICKVVEHLPIATERIPSTYIATLHGHPELTISHHFRAELERRLFLLRPHRLPVNGTVASASNVDPVVCEETGLCQSPVKTFAAFFPNVELVKEPATAPFFGLPEISLPPCLCDTNNGTDVDPVGHESHDTVRDLQPFLYFYDPYY